MKNGKNDHSATDQLQQYTQQEKESDNNEIRPKITPHQI